LSHLQILKFTQDNAEEEEEAVIGNKKEEEWGQEEEEEKIKEDNNTKKLTKKVNVFTFRFTCVTQYIGNDSSIGGITHEASRTYNTLGMHVFVLYISSIDPFIHTSV